MAQPSFVLHPFFRGKASLAALLPATGLWSLVASWASGAWPPAWAAFWNAFLGYLAGTLLMCLAAAWMVSTLYRLFRRKPLPGLFWAAAWLIWLAIVVTDAVGLH